MIRNSKSARFTISKNALSGAVNQVFGMISALILSRLILVYWGSDYNGLTSSIIQFLSVIALVTTGIGGVTKAALYKPLANNDTFTISGIFNATKSFMRKSTMIFSFALLLLASIYPFISEGKYDWSFTFLLVIIIGSGTIGQYLFGVTNQLLLHADQKSYVVNYVSTVILLLNLALSSFLITQGGSILIVKLSNTILNLFIPLFLLLYVKKNYQIDYSAKPDTNAISQRWHAFAQHAALSVHNNADVVILTLFSVYSEISVYVIYSTIISSVQKVVNIASTGIEAVFGNQIALNDNKSLSKYLNTYELFTYTISNVFYLSMMVLIVPFIKVYTSGITDANYIRTSFALIFILSQVLLIIRKPYELVINAAGHFQKTKKYSIIEAIVNVVISLALVFKFGLIGIIIATLIANLYKFISIHRYVSKFIIQRSSAVLFKNISIMLIFLVFGYISINYIFNNGINSVSTYVEWIKLSFSIFSLVILYIITVYIVFYRNELRGIIITIISYIRK